MSQLIPIHDPQKGKMRVAALVSGSGVSLRGILVQAREMESRGGAPYEVVAAFTDNPSSKAHHLAAEFDLPVFSNDIHAFYRKRGAPIKDLAVRAEFDQETVRLLAPFRPDLLAYAGYVWVTTWPLVQAFRGINFHPADLSVPEGDKPRYAGMHGLRKALLAGEKELRAALHLVTTEVDRGPILLLSEPVPVAEGADTPLEELERHYLRLLNLQKGPLFARATKDIAEGTFKMDAAGLLHYGETPIPGGYRL